MEEALITLLSSELSDEAKFEFVELELLKGSNPNYIDPDRGISLMHLAAGEGPQMLRLMLLHGGDPNIMSVEKLTPLHVAASWGHTASVSLLLQSGADISLRDQDGLLAIDLAIQFGHEDCVHLLEHQHKKMAHLQEQAIEDYLRLTYKTSAQNSLLPSNSAHHLLSPLMQSIESPSPCPCIRESWSSSYDKHLTMKPAQTSSAQEHSPHVHIPVCSLCHNTAKIQSHQSSLCSKARRSYSITKALYDYLEGGRKVVFDVTSPNTPYIKMKGWESEVPFSPCTGSSCKFDGRPCQHCTHPEPCGAGQAGSLLTRNSPSVNMSSKGNCGETRQRNTRRIPTAEMYAASRTTFQNARSSPLELNEKTNLCHIDPEHSDPSVLFKCSSVNGQCSPTIKGKMIPRQNSVAYSPPDSALSKRLQSSPSHADTGLGSSQLTDFALEDDVPHEIPIHSQFGSCTKQRKMKVKCLSNEQDPETDSKQSKDCDCTSAKETKLSYFPALHPLPPAVDPERRVAEFVLSTTELLEQCSIREAEVKSNDKSGIKQVSGTAANISNSSSDSFQTCNDTMEVCATQHSEINQHTQASNHHEEYLTLGKPWMESKAVEGLNALKDSPRNCENGTGNMNIDASRWKPPTSFMLNIDDLMTSDDSFVNSDKETNSNINSLGPLQDTRSEEDTLTLGSSFVKNVRSPRIYRMKRKKVEGNATKLGQEIPKTLTEKIASTIQRNNARPKKIISLSPKQF